MFFGDEFVRDAKFEMQPAKGEGTMQPITYRDQEFIRDLQRFLARYATTGSTFRNIGFSGELRMRLASALQI